MHSVRVLVRLPVVLSLIVGAFFIARRTLLNRYSGTTPIAISTDPAPATFERAFPNIVLKRPVGLAFPPDGTNRIAVISQYGSMFMFPNNPNTEEPNEVLNISHKVAYKDSSNEEGLLGLAFHPKFRENRQFFLYYTLYTTTNHVNILSRFTMSADDPNRADPSSEEEILRSPEKPSWNHNGGTILFGPDGYLYVSIGDGGPNNDPHGNGQKLETILGKILRIDVVHRDPDLNYAIPKDNPFINVPSARGEIWALGLRNVWRMAFDRPTGRLWAGEVGQDTWEEIDLIARGGNYGWNIREGFEKFATKDGDAPASPPDRVVGNLIDPVFAYDHSVGKAVIGGCVYHGKLAPEISGLYLFADHVTGQVYTLRFDDRSGRALAVQPFQRPAMPVFSFGEDESGEVYFTTTQGVINRIVSAKNQPRQSMHVVITSSPPSDPLPAR